MTISTEVEKVFDKNPMLIHDLKYLHSVIKENFQLPQPVEGCLV